MPYIKKEDRNYLIVNAPRNCGELNYCITELINAYLLDKDLCYQTCNDIVGALDNAKHEFRRRVQDNYEIKKSIENGDVYHHKFTI